MGKVDLRVDLLPVGVARVLDQNVAQAHREQALAQAVLHGLAWGGGGEMKARVGEARWTGGKSRRAAWGELVLPARIMLTPQGWRAILQPS